MSEREELERSIAALEAQRAVLGDAVVDPAVTALREKLAGLEAPPARPVGEAQRKQVTVLFADVSGFTAMSETMDAEDVSEVMNYLWMRLDGAITDQSGLIDKHIGDCVMALFGAPTAREDDPERAIRAALRMQAELSVFREERGAKLAMRIGINTGPVLLGEVGTTSEYTAMGDVVNLASRLEHAAPVGGILISHDTYRHVRGVFDVQTLEPIEVKGKAEPIQVYVVQQAKPRPFRVPTRGVEGVETRMVGREGELRQLQEALRAAVTEGEIRVVTVLGEAGVGKSRLLYEFNNWIELQPEAVTYFRGRATQEMSNLPYALIRDMFARRFGIRDSDPGAVARDKLERGIVATWGAGGAEGVEKAHFIGQLIGFDFSDSLHLRGVTGDARQIRDRAFHYVAQFFAAAGTEAPVAVFLEDIHWADDGSLDLVSHLERACRDAPLVIVSLARPTLLERRPLWGAEDGRHARLELRPLSEQDSRHLVDEILRLVGDVPPDLRELVVRGAEGNPFYVEELIKMLIEDGVIVKEGECWRVEMGRLPEVRVPPTLTGVLQARLDRLPTVEREALQRASVVGRVFWDDAIERIGESAGQQISKSASQQIGKSAGRQIGKGDGVGEVLRALQGRELVFRREGAAFAGTEEYIFRHAILLDVTYESVLRRLRRVYHAQVAAWLIEHSGERVEEYAGRIGEHFELAEKREQAATWYGRAGRQAQGAFALETALSYYQRALAFEKRWEWLKGQVEVLHILGRRDEEQAGLRALEAASGVHDYREAEAAYLWGQYYEALGHYEQAQAAAERALGASQGEGDVAAEVRCLAQLGLIARRQGDYAGARERYDQALTVLQRRDERSGAETQALAQTLNGLGTVHRQQGDFDQARERYEQALGLYQASGNRKGEAETLNDLGVTAFYQRRFAEAEAYHQQALEVRRVIGDWAGEGMSLNNLAQLACDTGAYSQAQQYMTDALAIYQAIGDRWDEANAWNSMGIIYQELGDLAEAEACLQRGLSLSKDIGDEAGQAYILGSLGLVMRDRGDLEAAERLLTDGLVLAEAQADKRLVSLFLSHLGLLNLRLGRLERADEQANAALTVRREMGLRLFTADDLATLAAVHFTRGDLARALDYAQQTMAILDECQGEGLEFPQQDYFTCYQVLMADGQAEVAQAALESACRLVRARADKIVDPDLRRSFLEQVAINREIVEECERGVADD